MIRRFILWLFRKPSEIGDLTAVRGPQYAKYMALHVDAANWRERKIDQ